LRKTGGRFGTFPMVPETPPISDEAPPPQATEEELRERFLKEVAQSAAEPSDSSATCPRQLLTINY